MNPKTAALNNKMIGQVMSGKSRAVGSGKFQTILGKSKSGPCDYCKKMASSSHNIGGVGKTPPYHANCKCNIK